MSKAFIQDVEKEVRALKRNITKTEVEKLSIEYLNPSHVSFCIYGQLAGHCASTRAQELMNKCCKREFAKFPLGGTGGLEKLLEFPTSKYKGSTWKDTNEARTFEYISALEGYILCDEADTTQIFNYLKGHIGKLDLQSVHF